MKYSPTEFLKTATATAEHFGFRTTANFKKEPLCKHCKTTLPHNITDEDRASDSYDGILANALTTYCEDNLHALEEPVLLYSVQKNHPSSTDVVISFDIFNVHKSIAEAILIQVGRSLMQDLGHTNHTVRVNSLGDDESNQRYNRELTNFLRKRLDTMPITARESMKEHSLKALLSLMQEDHELAYKCPNPLEFLNDQSRKHFREIIEYLDMTETPYEIDPKMVSNYDCYSDALFSIEDLDSDPTEQTRLVVNGGRYNKFVFDKTRSHIPAAGIILSLNNTGKSVSRIPKLKDTKADVYVVQLGFGPKIRSLMIIEELRRAGVLVKHNLSSDSLSAQLREAEASGMRYAVIIGQKEFIDQTVILRDIHERNQENISPIQMVRKLKRRYSLT